MSPATTDTADTPARSAPQHRQREKARGEATVDIFELCIHVVRADERTVVHGSTERQSAVPSEQFAVLGR